MIARPTPTPAPRRVESDGALRGAKTVLVTGAAGFIGSHVAAAPARARRPRRRPRQPQRLLRRRAQGGAARAAAARTSASRFVRARRRRSRRHRARCSRASGSSASCTSRRRPACATRSQNPHAYVDSNIVGFLNILEGCRHSRRRASRRTRRRARSTARTRSMPFSVHDNVDHPGQPLRRDQEGERADGAHATPPVRPADAPACASSPCTAVGPAGHGAVPVHAGDPRRASRSTSSTTARCSATSPTSTTSSKAWSASSTVRRSPTRPGPATSPDPATSHAPYRIYNIGNNEPVKLMELHRAARAAPRHAGAAASCCRCSPATCPRPTPTSDDMRRDVRLCARRPRSRKAVRRFVEWYRSYYLEVAAQT